MQMSSITGIEAVLDRPYQGLIAHGKASDELHINPKALRPCVATLLKTSFCKGALPSRGDVSAVIAAELVKIGYEHDRILYELTRWNKGNIPEIKQSALQSTVRTALRNNYNYSCKHHIVKEFCVGFDVCVHAKGLSNRSKYDFRAFFKYRWPEVLKGNAVAVYWAALPELEKKKGIKPGSVIYESHEEIAKHAGMSRKHVKGVLEKLAGQGLISYVPGIPRRWEGKASEIRRIFPIPKPRRDVIMRLEIKDEQKRNK